MSLESLYRTVAVAVQNEVTVNDYYMNILVGRSSSLGVPGCYRLTSSRINSLLFKVFLRFVHFFWPFFISPLVNFYFLIASLYFKLRLQNHSELGSPKTLFFASSDTTINAQKKILGDSCMALYRPRRKENKNNDNDLDVLQLLTVYEVCIVYLEAIYCTIRFSYDCKSSSNRLYSVFFFDLILMYRAFGKIKLLEELYTGDHFDRWAVLLDVVAEDKERIRSFTIIQHGRLSDANGCFQFDLPVKLNSVDSIYCFDEESYFIFKESIIGGGKSFSVNYFKNSIVLSSVPGFSDVVILIVGNSLCYNFHVLILKAMLSGIDRELQVFYKPHPAQDLDGIDKEDWEVIWEPKFFPKADLVISYPSTLVEQYREHNIPVIIHNISAGREDVNLVLCDVSYVLNNVSKSRFGLQNEVFNYRE